MRIKKRSTFRESAKVLCQPVGDHMQSPKLLWDILSHITDLMSTMKKHPILYQSKPLHMIFFPLDCTHCVWPRLVH